MIDLTPEEKACDYDWQLVSVGQRFVRTAIEFVPAKMVRREYFIKVYKKVRVDGSADPVFVQPHVPNAVITRSMATASLLAKIIHDKYELDVPLYRQIKDLQRLGLDVSETTLCHWTINSAEVLAPLYDLMHNALIHQPFLQGDETPTQVLKEPGRKATSKSYMWAARTVRSCATPVVYYTYNQSRGGQVAKDLYSGFTGVLQCDGYSGYNNLKDVKRVGCWAHVRRKFYETVRISNTLKTCEPLKLIDYMFFLENMWHKLAPKARRRLRHSKMKRLLKQFWSWCDTSDALPKSGFGKAIKYAQDQRPYLNVILQYGAIDWSNNATERNMKSYVMGRKNFLFNGVPEGAKANAILMTMIEIAKANGLDPMTYIVSLLDELAQFPEWRKSSYLGDYLVSD
ncbi:IS66 family transposase [Lacticaseibacillus paracasei]|uniref:IS66 family transposase n=1 Tax=Lacticaseibacillus paracasei TaxID=1597 RepID=UPI003C300B71